MPGALVHRVARAICCHAEGNPAGCQAQCDGGEFSVCQAGTYINDALAAIRAMRIPDPRMVAAALPLIEQPSEEQRAYGKAALALLPPVRIEQHFQGEQSAAELVRDWQTMIDAAAGARGEQ